MSSPPSASDALAPRASSSGFGRLHPRLQRWVWRQGWTALRDVQEEAVAPLLDGEEDVVIASATASGKTEAIYLPLCTRLAARPAAGVRVLAVSPLKALINDQQRRLEELAGEVGLPVHSWHGDVPSSRKQALLERPDGILLITPESLEALFVLRGPQLAGLFAGLDRVVVDELHAFMGSERGRQLQSLLHRLELALRRRVPRAALSATLGDMQLAAAYLRPGGRAERVRLIVSDRGGRELKLQLRGYGGPGGEGAEDGHRAEIADHLFHALRSQDNLVFANTRANVEHYADVLRRRCAELGVPNEFFAHHGNLSRELRERVERRLKQSSFPTTAVCTTTLELGIDVGSVASIGQIGAPFTVAGLRQRLGRSGRAAGDPSVLRLYVEERPIEARTPPQDALRAELVQSVAMVELLLERWYEPPVTGALGLSTLVQQVMSVIAQHGGAHAVELYRALCESGPFAEVGTARFATLLRDLAASELLAQAADGTILLGPRGERIVNHYAFYAAFQSTDEYRLVAGGRELGTVPLDHALTVGGYLIFAGRRWRVERVEDDRRVIHVAPAAGGRAPAFAGAAGAVHDRIRSRMRSLYEEDRAPAYLDASARALLAEGRAAFSALGLARRSVIGHGDDTLVFPWAGDRIAKTIALQLKASGLRVAEDGIAIVVVGEDEDVVRRTLEELATAGPPDAEELARLVENLRSEKYHRFLGKDLLVADYARRALDPAGAAAKLRELRALCYVRST